MRMLDLKKKYKSLYTQRSGAVTIIEVPEFQFLAVDGRGDPNIVPEFHQAIEALYAVAYTLKFSLKKRAKNPIDYPVMPLEALWWVPDMRKFNMTQKDAWLWRAMIMQPPVIDEGIVDQCIMVAAGKKDLPALKNLHLVTYNEGLSGQVLHIGPYSTEGPTIQRLHDHIASEGYERSGKHHEIYLGDPRRAAPEKLKTIVRQPVKKGKDSQRVSVGGMR
jgi:hypothetical protein